MGLDADNNSNGLPQYEESKFSGIYDLFEQVIKEDSITISEKIKELISLKATVLFELQYGENYATYQTIHKDFNDITTVIEKQKELKVKKKQADRKAGGDDVLFDDFNAPVFNNQFHERLKLLNLFEAIEFAIYDINATGKNTEPIPTKPELESNISSKDFHSKKWGALITLMKQEGVIKGTDVKISQFMELISPYTKVTLRKKIIEGFSTLTKEDLLDIEDILKRMLNTIQHEIQIKK